MSFDIAQLFQDNIWAVPLISAAIALVAPLISRIEFDWRRKSILRDIEIFLAWKDYGSSAMLSLIKKQIDCSIEKKYDRSAWLIKFSDVYNPIAASLNGIGSIYYFCCGKWAFAAIYAFCAIAIAALAVYVRRWQKRMDQIDGKADDLNERLVNAAKVYFDTLVFRIEEGAKLDDVFSKIDIYRAAANKYVEVVSGEDPIAKRKAQEIAEAALLELARETKTESRG